ncbi:MAG: fatty acid desaturase [Rhodobacteraceae bacterium CG2_30_10_405]|nr:fatty acid desaturase [Rhodobacterales bacterium]NCO15789.1 fatty acid desaturase [Alphaproteobacteria bacterium]OIQ07131.1 MAG: fatty acid desaturase [Rhodobacteraceae bacterium CG2_30_10_405]
MTPEHPEARPDFTPHATRDWVQMLAKYRDPSPLRSLVELGVTLAAFVVIWALAVWALSFSWLAALALALLNGPFLVRLFAIQHDCGHAAYFRHRPANDWIGRALGVLTLTPYDVWRRSHSIHHSAAGNLDRRGIGDVQTLTVAEYFALTPRGRLLYRLYRNPAVLFGLGPCYIFFVNNRLPIGLMRAGWRYWLSAMATNLAIVAGLAGLYLLGGLAPIVLIWLPTSLVGATIGVWLFYVQHQFATTQWDSQAEWQIHDAALLGSSHYILPQPLQWLTANIGVHHVHHLYSRIPFYRLPEVLRDFPALAAAQRMTIRQSLVNVKLHLWDEQGRRLLSFAQARALQA